MKKIKLEVGIAAYNAQNNIGQLINSLLIQKRANYILNKVTVYSDASSDKTDLIVKKYHQKIIRLINPKRRVGFAQVVKVLIKNNHSDALMLLNDDIIIKDPHFIEKTVKYFYKSKNLGLVCSNPQPYKPGNFIEKAVTSGFKAFDRIKNEVKDGNTVLTCDGKTMTLTKDYAKSIIFPESNANIGNVDGFLYFSCIRNGFTYQFAKDAVVYFKCPSTLGDFLKWTIRNNNSKEIMCKEFGEKAIKEYQPPSTKFLYYRLVEFVKNPTGAITIFALSIYSRILIKVNPPDFDATWDTVNTTKNINYT